MDKTILQRNGMMRSIPESIKRMEKRKFSIWVNGLIFILFFIYLAVGVRVYKDYGISTDEPMERESTLINIKYILNFIDPERASRMEVPDLDTYNEKNYGTFLQMPSYIFEMGNQDLRDVFYRKHFYTFLLCLAGYIAFFFLCRILFESSLMGLLGAAMMALYPRFFAEQFYNIKDMVFVSMFMISMFATVKLIESRFQGQWFVFFAISIAIATNVRIVGIIFLILMLGYLLVDFILGKVLGAQGYEVQCKHPFIYGTALLIVYFILLVVLLPAAWKNPIQGIIDVFIEFSNYDWNGVIVFMGKIIKKEELPWYYVPVWMLISVPIWYILLCVLATVVCLCSGIQAVRKKENMTMLLFSRHKYLVWCVLLMAIPFLGIVFLHSSLYGGWRHCYFFLPPFVLFSLFGIHFLFRQGQKYSVVLLAIILIGGGAQIAWIGNNHPYEMVYFNNVGKHFGEYFDRDYWHVATKDAFRYIAWTEPDEKFSVKTSGTEFYKYLLEDNERSRIVEEEEPLYYIETYRGKIGNDLEKEGYEEIYTIMVDGFKITSIYKKTAKGRAD